MNLYCTSCQKFYQTDGMQQITEWKGHRKWKTALFLDKKNGTSHEFLNEFDSEKFKIYPAEPTSTINQPPTPPEAPSPAVIEAGSIECLEEVTIPDFHDFQPQPDEWFQAKLVSKNAVHLVAELSDGQHVFVGVEVVENLPQKHTCLLQPGDTMNLQVQRVLKGYNWQALSCVLDEGRVHPRWEEERGIVTFWSNRYGSVLRDCGCPIWVSTRQAYMLPIGEKVIVGGYEQSHNPKHRGELATEIWYED